MASDDHSLETLKEVLDAFNRHDLDAIMSHFARFEGIPDVAYRDDAHFTSGNRGVSEWTISGTTTEGERIEVRGCDLWTFGDDGRLSRKDSFWKIRD
jgi:hypothetical protein